MLEGWTGFVSFVQKYFIKVDIQDDGLLNIPCCFLTQPSSPVKFMSLFRILLVLTPLSLSPAAERRPEFASTAVLVPGEAGGIGLSGRVLRPVPEATSWSLLMGAVGCFLLVRKRC